MYKNSLPKRTGIYRINDNIECLEFIVQLKHINSLFASPDFEVNKNPEHYSQLGEQALQDGVLITACIGWQQKVFSAKELELYQDLKNCKTEWQRKCHEQLLLMSEAKDTYERVLRQKPRYKRSVKRKSHKKKESPHSPTSTNTSSAVSEYVASGTHAIFTYVHEDEYKPDDKLVDAKCYKPRTDRDQFVYMYVFAALSPDTELVRLMWQPEECLLFVYPDFSSRESTYYIEIDSSCRHLYSYSFENTSLRQAIEYKPPMTPDTDMLMKTDWHSMFLDPPVFELPPKRAKRVTLLLTLSTGQSFEYGNIHVRYYMVLPEYTVLERGLLTGSTHTCLGGGATLPAHFNHNWDVTLLCEEHFKPDLRLHIYFEVISIDSWGRERTEGYAHYACMLLGRNVAGLNTVQLPCVRPLGTWLDSLNRYFIGGREYFDWVEFFNPQSTITRKSEPLSMHIRPENSHMQTTGYLNFSISQLKQRYREILIPYSDGMGNSILNLEDIRRAYFEAFEKLNFTKERYNREPLRSPFRW